MILLLDNYDSFVHNLARHFRLLGHDTEVVRSDRLTVDDVQRIGPAAVVLSPGPKRPEDAGCCLDVVRTMAAQVPILGVCLGHQVIGQAFGARIHRSRPQHGRSDQVTHDGRGLFAGLPSPLCVGRYHSLAIDPASMPGELRVTAVASDATVMAVQHRRLPVQGVQFHPESVLTDHGLPMLQNFCRLIDPSRFDRSRFEPSQRAPSVASAAMAGSSSDNAPRHSRVSPGEAGA